MEKSYAPGQVRQRGSIAIAKKEPDLPSESSNFRRSRAATIRYRHRGKLS